MSKQKSCTLSINVNGNDLECVDNEKLLGVYIDPSLSFNKQVDHVCRSITSKLALLRRIKVYLPLSYRKLYYNAYILPCIDYCLTIWGNSSKNNLERIHKLQKYAARIILDVPIDSPSLPLFNELGWLNVFERMEFNKAVPLLSQYMVCAQITYPKCWLFNLLQSTAYDPALIKIWAFQSTGMNYLKEHYNIRL